MYHINSDTDVITKLPNLSPAITTKPLDIQIIGDFDYFLLFDNVDMITVYSGSNTGVNKTYTKLSSPSSAYTTNHTSYNTLSPNNDYIVSTDTTLDSIVLHKLYYNPFNMELIDTMSNYNAVNNKFISEYGFINYSSSINDFGESVYNNKVFSIENEVIQDIYDIDYDIYFIDKLNSNHNQRYYLIDNPNPPYVSLLEANSILTNKTSLRLNPDIKLELDVNYPLGKVTNLISKQIDGIKKYNSKDISDVDNINGKDVR